MPHDSADRVGGEAAMDWLWFFGRRYSGVTHSMRETVDRWNGQAASSNLSRH